MTTASLPILEITTIYSARSVSRRRGWSGHVVGMASLILALLGLYVLWSRIDPFLSERFRRSIPLAAYVDITAFFAPPPKDIANPAPPSGTQAQSSTPAASKVSAEDRLANIQSANTYTTKLTALLYSWESLATITGLILAWAGGAGITGHTLAQQRRSTLLLLAGSAAFFTLVFCWWVWARYGLGWEINHVHMLIALLAFLVTSLGALGSKGGRTSHHVAAVALITFALLTLIALAWANKLQAMPEGFVTLFRYLQVGLPAGLYGMLLLTWVRRAPRKPVTA